MKNKILCGRSDCSFNTEKGICSLKQISIGKDMKCQSYRVSSYPDMVRVFKESAENLLHGDYIKVCLDNMVEPLKVKCGYLQLKPDKGEDVFTSVPLSEHKWL
jgi:hypothetical protein